MFHIQLTFCTYFKNIERFRYKYEIYKEYVAFCVKQGSFAYRIGEDGEEKIVSEGELIICPPNEHFYRRIIQSTELCMIKFQIDEDSLDIGKIIKISNILRWNENLVQLENCLFCNTLSSEPLWAHYCMDIIYLAMEHKDNEGKLFTIKQYLEQNFDKNIRIRDLAGEIGYTTPHFICKFKQYYGVTPKAYLSKVKIQKAKELLLGTDMLSREIANVMGFNDELYFIHFFKKQTGFTPQQFRKHSL